jgi:hypothetical protein
MKFICDIPESNVHEILTYNEILDHIERDNQEVENDMEQLYKFVDSLHIKALSEPQIKTIRDQRTTCHLNGRLGRQRTNLWI